MVLLSKLFIGITLPIMALYLCRLGFVLRISSREFKVLLISVSFLLRITLFIVSFFVLKLGAQSDVLVYADLANLLLAGNIPGATPEFPVHYGPLFYYLAALPLLKWSSPEAIVAFFLVIDVLAILCWHEVALKCAEESVARKSSLLYAFFPLGVVTAGTGGNNDIIIGLVIPLALLAAFMGRHALSGLLVAVGLLAAKFLVLLQAPLIFIYARLSSLWLVVFFSVSIGCYALFYVLGTDIVGGVLFHAGHNSSGNLPFLLEGLLGELYGQFFIKEISSIIGILLIIGVYIYVLVRRPVKLLITVGLCGAILLLAMIFSSKSFPHYLVTSIYGIFLLESMRAKVILHYPLLLLFGALTTIESSLWFRWYASEPLSKILSLGNLDYPRLILFISVEFLLIGVYILLAYRAIAYIVKQEA